MLKNHGNSRLNVEFLKKEAKQWLQSLHADDPNAIARLDKALPAHDKNVTLRTIQHAIARERGLDSWLALTESIEARERELREVADEILKHAVFKGDPAVATRLFNRHPDVARLDIFIAVAAGDLKEVERRLAIDPNAAVRAGGPLNWPPLLYLAYSRLPGSATQSLNVARALLEHGADPNSSWNDDWSNKFTALTGVIALGEGVQPPHERADDFVNLLVERGADPCDSQTFYNMSIVSDDVHWLDVLWSHSERLGVTNKWREVSPVMIGGNRNMSPLDFMLSLAVSYNHQQRAEWLLAHGGNANGIQAYSGRRLRDEALVYGNGTLAALLVRYGAADEQLPGNVAFKVACRNVDKSEARRLSALHPECLHDAEVILTAAREGSFAIVELLLELGMEVDIANGDGVRALNLAAMSGSLDIIKLLIARGADIDKPTKHYGGPLGFAGHFGQHAAAAILAPLSRDVHNLVYLGMKDRLHELFAAEPALANLVHPRGGNTPLFSLPDEESAAIDMAQFLLKRGADASIRNQENITPAEAARKRGFAKAQELLVKAIKLALRVASSEAETPSRIVAYRATRLIRVRAFIGHMRKNSVLAT